MHPRSAALLEEPRLAAHRAPAVAARADAVGALAAQGVEGAPLHALGDGVEAHGALHRALRRTRAVYEV
jgi:hypothetical protein